MKALACEAQFTEGVDVPLALLSYVEEGVHVIYSPALDLYGYGNDELEARAGFATTLEEYLSFTAEENSLSADLSRLGWVVNPQSHSVTMPAWTSLLDKNPYLNDVIMNRPFKKFDQPTRFPAFA